MLRTTIVLAAILAAAAAQAQTPPPIEWGPTHIWTQTTNGWKLIPLAGVEVSADGTRAQVASSQTLVMGPGLSAEQLPGRITIFVDVAWLQYVLYRQNTTPPSPGPCDPVKVDALMRVDPRGWWFLCAPDPGGGYRWMRGVLQSDW